MNILVLAPHPDDDLLGCGGSMVKHVKNGNNVHVAYVTSGEAGLVGTYTHPEKIREKEAVHAVKSIDIPAKNLYFLRQPDGFVVDTPGIINQLIHIIRECRPSVVYIPHSQDAHPDHVATHVIGLKAILQAGMPYSSSVHSAKAWAVSTVLAYEVWTPIQEPSYLEVITDVIDQKINALQFYSSQLKSVSYDDVSRGLAVYRGALLGHGCYAEAFSVLRMSESLVTANTFSQYSIAC